MGEMYVHVNIHIYRKGRKWQLNYIKVAAKHNTDEQEKAPGTMYLAAFFFF